MKGRAQIRMLADGRRLHLHDGPIDLIVEAFGGADQIARAYHAAAARFETVLDELCSELACLRRAADGRADSARGVVAKRMCAAVRPFASRTFITPMAAVAGAVAEEILLSMTKAADLERAYVNNGGDIAIHLTEGEQLTVGLVQLPDPPSKVAEFDSSSKAILRASILGDGTIDYLQAARGIATSGWRGRSFSLGIADSVTVLAETASMADAAATVIANAVDLPGHPSIIRVPACDLAPDSDLGDRAITYSVGELTHTDVESALAAGCSVAQALRASGLICTAALSLQGHVEVVADEFVVPLRDPTSFRMTANG